MRRIGVRCEVRSGSGARWEGEAYQAYREARRKVGYGEKRIKPEKNVISQRI